MPQKIRIIFVAFLLLVSNLLFAQFKSIKGVVIGNGDVEGIHILNQSSVKYDVTDTDGSFEVFAKLNDTLVVSALKYKTKTVILNTNNFNKTILQIKLQEKIDELEEVFVGKILTGSLNSDVKNTETEVPINFYNLGIPGYTGIQKTLSERKLAEAKDETGSNNLGAAINLLTGRTKMLEERVQTDKNIKCVNRFKNIHKEIIFEGENLSETLQNRFFNSLIDYENIQNICEERDVLFQITFLKAEFKIFKSQLKENDKKN